MKVIHVDMDAFYASVEIKDNPKLVGKPIAVGGRAESRGVVATASYAARKFGVRSAMPMKTALKLCPGLQVLPPRFDRYRSISQDIRAIFRSYTAVIEPLSLDEAYLDVTDHPTMTATQIAVAIRNDIAEQLNLTASAGVAPNKMIAKIASDIRKPNGITIVTPEQVEGFMRKLAVDKISGVGPVTGKRLAALGIHYCEDIAHFGLAALTEQLGQRMGSWLFTRAQGHDPRKVETNRIRKSLGTESTFEQDITDSATIQQKLADTADCLVERLESCEAKGKTLTVKVKYNDFKQSTRSMTRASYFQDKATILTIATELLAKTQASQKPIRLLGLTLSNLSSTGQSTEPSTSIFAEN